MHVRQAKKCRSLVPLVKKQDAIRALEALAYELEQRAADLTERARTAPTAGAHRLTAHSAASVRELSLGVSEIADAERALAARSSREN